MRELVKFYNEKVDSIKTTTRNYLLDARERDVILCNNTNSVGQLILSDFLNKGIMYHLEKYPMNNLLFKELSISNTCRYKTDYHFSNFIILNFRPNNGRFKTILHIGFYFDQVFSRSGDDKHFRQHLAKDTFTNTKTYIPGFETIGDIEPRLLH